MNIKIRFCVVFVLILNVTYYVVSQPIKCDHTPTKATVKSPSDEEHTFRLSIDTKTTDKKYLPDQTYLVTLSTTNNTRPFKWFLITVEDPDVDNILSQDDLSKVDVGTLKPLKGQSRHSENCFNTVEETDYSDKTKVEVHWISPKQSSRPSVRLRAMVAENQEVWYTGANLTIEIGANNMKPIDSPPYDVNEICHLCSEARYEVIFKGHWSRITHPHHYPKEPDRNGYSDMIGASHTKDFILWKPGYKASPGLKLIAELGDISIIQKDIIANISEDSGVRTLIKGRGHMHPHMSLPSYALFRVDKVHHLFSVIISLIPSPDWFLGTSMFELCTENGWLDRYEIPLYPWDAGTANGISYESIRSVTQPVDNVQRVQVGSFDEASPFYQMNLNDLKPFATLEVHRLDVYPISDGSCEERKTSSLEEETLSDDINIFKEEEPNVAEYKVAIGGCENAEWSDWSPCVPSNGVCGGGMKTRKRIGNNYINEEKYFRYMKQSGDLEAIKNNCNDADVIETQQCLIECDYFGL